MFWIGSAFWMAGEPFHVAMGAIIEKGLKPVAGRANGVRAGDAERAESKLPRLLGEGPNTDGQKSRST